ncbi:MAG TPA: LPS-assembly protein LptD [Alphaproteobacteria bacterium]|nr:LPS-assembly protein LptD [Alphaproteobacteria bacterium]
MLAYNAQTTEISAEGGVILRYEGYTLTADRVTYNRTTGDVFAVGNVGIRDPLGNVYTAERMEVTGEMKRGFVESLTITTPEGAVVTAKDVNYASELETILTDATYSPCGLCIDSKGRRIGWKVNASKMIYDRDRALVFLEGAGLELLGIPVAWVPWFVVQDPTQPRKQGFRTPSISSSDKLGVRLDVPYFVPIADDMDLLLSPALMTRQGALLSASFTHRLPWGYYDVKASGIYQLDPSAFTFPEAQTNWRGAIQTSGEFTPLENWKAGWSYTAFTDAAFLIDYDLRTSKNVVNEAYATYLTRDTFFDIRARQFNLLGDVTQADQAKQTKAIPTIEAAQYVDLAEFGHVELYGKVLGVQRGADSQAIYNGVPYTFAYQENKVHAMLQGSWQNQYVLPAGLVATPYLGLRLDAGYYDGSSGLLAGPISLFDATPIAAMDIRWPLAANSGYDSYLFEPVAQLVYRGSSTTLPGITNDDAQSFVFDDTLLFSYNRFSGIDRQETGLRANLGARYIANFADGGWLQLIGGQSYFLAGTNSLATIDHAQTGNATGLGSAASYIVLGAQGSPGGGVDFGAKAQIDPNSFRIMRAVAASNVALGDYRIGGAYTYIPANPAIGTIADQHEATASVSGPLPLDYWYADANVSWDLAQNAFLNATGGITYDDGYLVLGGFAGLTGPTHTSPNAFTWGVKFRLRGPGLGEWGY